MQQIAVIDYGMGNLRSVSKALEAVADNATVVVTGDVDCILESDRVVCPGQGAARDCMRALNDAGLSQTLKMVIDSRPFLGICMGLQVLLSRSDENDGIDCLDVIPGTVRRFTHQLSDEQGGRLKVPHMGWSQVKQIGEHPLWSGIADQSRFYFAHSYFIQPEQESIVKARCTYGSTFAVAIAQRNLFACQFHPEKSADNGLQLLRNFTRWEG